MLFNNVWCYCKAIKNDINKWLLPDVNPKTRFVDHPSSPPPHKMEGFHIFKVFFLILTLVSYLLLKKSALQIYWLKACYNVSVLWQEQGYTVKYSLSTKEIPRGEPKGFLEGSGYISPYIPTWVIIQTCSISKSYISSMAFLDGQYWKSWFSVLVWQLGWIFLYCQVGEEYESIKTQ